MLLLIITLLFVGCSHITNKHEKPELVCSNGFLFCDGKNVGRCDGEEDLPFLPNGEPDFDLELFSN